MKKEYDTSVKEAIERVMSVFSEYIKTTPYFDIVWTIVRCRESGAKKIFRM